MKSDGAMRLAMSPDEVRAWVNFLRYQGRTLPRWAIEWDGVSGVWLDDYEEGSES